MRVCIYGAGSLGTVLGAYLAKAGTDVELVTRNAAHVHFLNERGARITGTVSMTVPVKALAPDSMAGAYDWIFLMTKQHDNPEVAKGLAGYLGPSGALCTFQNGIPEYSVAEAIGEDRVYGCATGWGATLKGDGTCELTSDPEHLVFNIGKMAGTDPGKLAELEGLLRAMGTVVVEKNFIGARWSKLLINCAFSGVSAVLGCTFGEAAKDRESRKVIHGVMKECIDAARAEGVTLEPVQGKNIAALFDYRSAPKRMIAEALLPLAIKKHAGLKASMLQDLEAGKKTEVDFINGLVCAAGARRGVPTPLNRLVVDLVRGIESGALRPGFENLARFEKREN